MLLNKKEEEMPHVEIKYSNDIDLDSQALFGRIEKEINDADPSAGACKSRAYPTDQYHHTHILVSINLLSKQHRDDAFSKNLLGEILKVVKDHVKDSCFLSLEINYQNQHYITTEI